MLAIAALAFGAAYALAAGAHVSAPTLGAGVAPITACQSAPVAVGYGFSAQSTLEVSIGGLDTAAGSCGGRSLLITLHTASHVDHSQVATVPLNGSSLTLTYPDVDPATAIGVTIALASNR